MATQEATKETEAAGLRSGAADPNADGTGAKAAGLFFLMLKIGLFTWGGGWSIVAQMQKDFCEKNRWFTQRELVDYVTLARSLPGILTINISVIVGKSLGGWPLALVAAAGIVLPSVAVLVAVSAFLTAYSGAPLVVKALAGVRAAVVPIVALAGWKMLKASVVDKRTAAILILSFAAAQFTPANKILIIAAGGLAGLALQLGAAWKAKGAGEVTLLLFKIFSIFAKISYFCFGGYAMIPLINQEMGNLHWMTPTEVANLFAMAEMLPGSVVVNMSTYCGIRQAGIPGALAGALGVMMPSLTVGLLAAHYLPKVKDGFWVSSALYGLRPVTVAMIFLTVVSLVPTSFFLASGELSVRSLSIAGAVLGAALAFKADTVVQVSIGAVLGILLM